MIHLGLGIAAAAFSAALGSLALSLCLQNIELWTSIFPIALVACLTLGSAAALPWVKFINCHGYISALIGGIVIGGLVGDLILCFIYLNAPSFKKTYDLIVVLMLWTGIGAIFGGTYSIVLKCMLQRLRRAKMFR